MAHQIKTALQQLASGLQHQTAELVHLRSIVAAQAEQIARLQTDLAGARNVGESVGGKDVTSRERRKHDGGYFVDALRVSKQRRRTDTLLPVMSLSELPTMKAALVASKAVESKPKIETRPNDDGARILGSSGPRSTQAGNA